jgi:hypothetical protein
LHSIVRNAVAEWVDTRATNAQLTLVITHGGLRRLLAVKLVQARLEALTGVAAISQLERVGAHAKESIVKQTLELILTHRGVTLGTAIAGPSNVFASARTTVAPGDVELVFLPFEPTPAYSSIQSICRRAWQALDNFGLLGPAADPASDAAGREADLAACDLWAEIELRDAQERHISGRVVVLYDMGRENESTYWLDVSLDRTSADVAALFVTPLASAPAFESPVTYEPNAGHDADVI